MARKAKVKAGRAAAPRRAAPPKEAAVVAYPDAAAVPDWSEKTLALLERLTPLERAFVEWGATGMSAAEAYRKAAGSESGFAKQSAYHIRHRPPVAAALHAALKDRNVGARCDREWKLAKLRGAIEACALDEKNPKSQAAVGKLVMQMAQLQGEVGPKRGGEEPDGGPQRVNVSIRIDTILAGVAALIAQRTGGPAPALGWGHQGEAGGGGDDPLGAEHRPTVAGVPKSR